MNLPQLKVIQGILARFNKREKLILYGALAFVFIMFLDRMVITPVFQKMGSLDEEIRNRESNIKKNMRILAQKDRILSESAKYATFLGEARSEDEEVTSLLKEVEIQANKAGVYLVDIKPAGTKEIGTSRKYMVTLNCEAQMEQIVNFMYNIENSSRLLAIEKYQITPKSRDSSIAKCAFTISRIVMP